MSFSRYAALVCGSSAVSLAGLSATGLLEERSRWAVLFGGTLATMNALTAYSLVLWSAKRPLRSFLGAILGGMIGRMGVMLAAVAVAVQGLRLPTMPLVLSLLAYFVVFLILELVVLQRVDAAMHPEAR